MKLRVWRGSSENSENKIHVILKKNIYFYLYTLSLSLWCQLYVFGWPQRLEENTESPRTGAT